MAKTSTKPRKKRTNSDKPLKNQREIAQFRSKARDLTPVVPKSERETSDEAPADKPATPPSPLPALVKANNTPTVDFPAPDVMATISENRVLGLAGEALKLIQSEIVEELTVNPDQPIYTFDLSNSPSDVAGVIVNSLVSKRWRCSLNDARTLLTIELPQRKQVAEPFIQRISKVRPL